MEKKFILKGLECPHCSAEIETAISKLDGISSSNVNLIKQTLTVKVTDKYSGNLFSDITKTVHTYEPDVNVIEEKNINECCSCGYNHIHSHSKNDHSHCCDGHGLSHSDKRIHYSKTTNAIESVFTLKGLDCPHCSTEIENDLLNIDGIISANINLMKQLLTVSVSENYCGNLIADIEKTVHAHEPDVAVIDGSVSHKTENVDKNKNKIIDTKSNKFIISRLALGTLIYALVFLLPMVTTIPKAVELSILTIAYIILGADIVFKAFRNISKGRVFDENFLMTVSTIGAFVIGEYPEAVAVMLFYQVGEFFQSLAVKRSRKSISALMDIRPDSANVKRNGTLITVSPEEVLVGETIVVKPGEKIPLDGVIVEGESMLDTRALTGESVPKKAKQGDSVLSGCINESSLLSVEVTKQFNESTASKIIELVENAAGRKAPMENFITKFSRYYTPVVVIFAALLAIIPPLLFDFTWTESIRRGFVFLVISCPCALVISIPLTFFGGIGAASRKGVLVKGSNYLEALSNIETIVFDKTGTLTKGVFNVTKIKTSNNFSKEQVLEYAALAECMSNHPIARSIISEYKNDIKEDRIKNFKEVSGYGVTCEVDGQLIIAGNSKMMGKHGIIPSETNQTGTTVHIAFDGKYCGYIVISDEIKSDSRDAIAALKDIGVKKSVMLTGDNKSIAKFTAEELGLDEFYGDLLPAQKVEKVEYLDSQKSYKGKLAFVGDGINDAPVLARADIGIAMGALGSDAAIEAADVVLMTDEPSKLIDAINVSKQTKKIVTQNIVIVLLIKALFLILGAFGIAGMWEAVFGDVGVMIIAVINSMRILKK